MDEETYNLLGRIEIPGVIRVRLSEVENDELLSVKSERSQAEYCWTLTAFFTWYVMDTHREIDAITYLDSDLNDAESALLKTIKIYGGLSDMENIYKKSPKRPIIAFLLFLLP